MKLKYLLFFITSLSFLTGCSAGVSSMPVQAGDGLIHPLCVDELLSLEEGNSCINLKACQKRFSHIPFDTTSPWQASWKADGSHPDYYGFRHYQVIGNMEKNQTLLLFSANYGGSGTFSSALLVEGFSPYSPTLILSQKFSGGDRCMGGLKQVRIESPETFSVVRNMSLYDLVEFVSGKQKTGLSYCARCCAGLITQRISLDGDPELESATIFPPQGSEQNESEKCFYNLLGTRHYSQTLAKEELTSLVDQFLSQCK